MLRFAVVLAMMPALLLLCAGCGGTGEAAPAVAPAGSVPSDDAIAALLAE